MVCDKIGYEGLQEAIDNSIAAQRIIIKSSGGDFVRASAPQHGGGSNCMIKIIDKSLSLIGEDGPLFDGSSSGDMNGICIINGNVSISGLKIKGFQRNRGEANCEQIGYSCSWGAGIKIEGGSPANVSVSNSVIYDNEGPGFMVGLKQNSIFVLENNVFHNNANSGTRIGDGTMTVTIRNNIFSSNVAYTGSGSDDSTQGDGMNFPIGISSNTMDVTHNLFWNNEGDCASEADLCTKNWFY